jgi:hypothetical protein
MSTSEGDVQPFCFEGLFYWVFRLEFSRLVSPVCSGCPYGRGDPGGFETAAAGLITGIAAIFSRRFFAESFLQKVF